MYCYVPIGPKIFTKIKYSTPNKPTSSSKRRISLAVQSKKSAASSPCRHLVSEPTPKTLPVGETTILSTTQSNSKLVKNALGITLPSLSECLGVKLNMEPKVQVGFPPLSDDMRKKLLNIATANNEFFAYIASQIPDIPVPSKKQECMESELTSSPSDCVPPTQLTQQRSTPLPIRSQLNMGNSCVPTTDRRLFPLPPQGSDGNQEPRRIIEEPPFLLHSPDIPSEELGPQSLVESSTSSSHLLFESHSLNIITRSQEKNKLQEPVFLDTESFHVPKRRKPVAETNWSHPPIISSRASEWSSQTTSNAQRMMYRKFSENLVDANITSLEWNKPPAAPQSRTETHNYKHRPTATPKFARSKPVGLASLPANHALKYPAAPRNLTSTQVVEIQPSQPPKCPLCDSQMPIGSVSGVLCDRCIVATLEEL